MDAGVRRTTRTRKRVLRVREDSDSDFEPQPEPNRPKKGSPRDVNQNKSKKSSARGTKTKQKTKAQKDEAASISVEVKCDVARSGGFLRLARSHSLPQLLHHLASGSLHRSTFSRAAVSPVMENVASLGVSKMATPFDRRTTALAWHPTHPFLAAAGSKGGDIILWDTSKRTPHFPTMIKGRGPGGSIQSLKFDTHHPDRVFTASIDGRVSRLDLAQPSHSRTYLATNDWERWYTGLDVSFTGRTMVAGNNKGMVTLLSLEGERIWELKLHKAKCNFVQFSERQPWLVVTTSIASAGRGGSVKVWDIRNISGPNSCLAELEHERAVNSAYFSPVSGDKLVTTDQHSQLRVYQAPTFTLSRTIQHPHRQFQHLTPIKACWHPLADIVLAGRYPDPKLPGYTEGELRSIDFYQPESGALLHQLHQPGLDLIISLSQFSPTGDRLLSGMGSSLLVWQPRQQQEGEERQESLVSNLPGVTVQQWPDFTAKKKAKSKKVKLTKTTES